MGKNPSLQLRKVTVRTKKLNKKNKQVIQTGEAFFITDWVKCCHKLGRVQSLQIAATVMADWRSYYKSGQSLFQNGTAVAEWVKTYYKLDQVLQTRAVSTNWWHSNNNCYKMTEVFLTEWLSVSSA